MAMNQIEINTIDKGMLACKQLLDVAKPAIEQVKIIYDTISSGITQDDLDSVQSYSGLTKQELDDGFFALGLIHDILKEDGSFSQLSKLAARK